MAIVAPVVKPTTASGRQAEQLDEPAGRDLLDDRRRPATSRTARRSGPRRWSASRPRAPPAASRRSRTRSSAARRCRSAPGRRPAPGPRRSRPVASPRSGMARRMPRAARRARGADRPVREPIEEVCGEVRGPVEEGATVGHGGTSGWGVPPSYAASPWTHDEGPPGMDGPGGGSRRGRCRSSRKELRVDAEPGQERLVVGLVEAVAPPLPCSCCSGRRRSPHDEVRVGVVERRAARVAEARAAGRGVVREDHVGVRRRLFRLSSHGLDFVRVSPPNSSLPVTFSSPYPTVSKAVRSRLRRGTDRVVLRARAVPYFAIVIAGVELDDARVVDEERDVVELGGAEWPCRGASRGAR